MKVGDRVIAIKDYKVINLKKNMTGVIEKIYNDGNKIIKWKDLDRSTYHFQYHDGIFYALMKDYINDKHV